MSGDPLNVPADVAKTRATQLGEQFAAAISDSLLTGMATAVAKMMTARTMTAGPWMLDAAGTLTALDVTTVDVSTVELLRQHVVDWGRCDDPDDCDCSDGRARRALGLVTDVTEQTYPTEHTEARRIDGQLLTHFIAMRDLLDEFAHDSGLNPSDTNYARVATAIADRLLNGEPR